MEEYSGKLKARLTPQYVRQLVKYKKALDMLVEGHSLFEIVESEGYSSVAALNRAIKLALAFAILPTLEDYRAVNIERLTTIIKVNWSLVLNPEKYDHWKATDKVLDAIREINEMCGIAEKNNPPNPLFGNPREVLIKLVYDRNRGNNDSLADTPCLPGPDKTQSG